VSGGVELTEGELVMVLVVQDVQEGGKERVEVLSQRKRVGLHVREREQPDDPLEALTSRMGNSERIPPSFMSKRSWVNLTFRM